MKVLGKNQASQQAGTFPRPLGASCLLGQSDELCASTCCGQRQPVDDSANPAAPGPLTGPKCVTAESTKLGGFCINDCQCETKFCNTGDYDDAIDSPKNTFVFSQHLTNNLFLQYCYYFVIIMSFTGTIVQLRLPWKCFCDIFNLFVCCF